MRNSRNSFHNPKLPVSIQPNIGLDSEVRKSAVEILNKILASETALTLSTRSALCNVSDAGFKELYRVLDSQYNQINVTSDELAERIAILGGSVIKTQSAGENDNGGEKETSGTIYDVLRLVDAHETCIRLLREDARKCTEELEDEGTFELLIGIMRSHEKMAWMLRSYIRKEPFEEESLTRGNE
jgi:starvation-inducible DNA-binding protein